MLKQFELDVLNLLIEDKVIPKCGLFQIEEHHLQEYIKAYHFLFGKSNKATKTNSNKRLARRLAGLTLLKLLFSRGAKFNQTKAGLAYLIGNPAFPDHWKIGMTIELENRLASYQTYSPYRDYYIKKYEFVLDRNLVEKTFLNHPNVIKEQGEWVKKEQVEELFEQLVFSK